MDLIDLYTVRDCHYFCRFELENVSSYEILPALDLTQSVHEIQSRKCLQKSNLNEISTNVVIPY